MEDGRTGLLSQPGDAQALAANVIRLLNEPELASQLIANAFEQSKQYHWDAVREQWLAVYRSMLGSAVRPARNSPDPVAEPAELAEPVNPNR